MDFRDYIKQLADRVSKLKNQLQTEEATKNALIMPFIQCLGYDVFNPFEVVPEFVSDIGTKKGEKVDYAIVKDDIPILSGLLVDFYKIKQRGALFYLFIKYNFD